MGMTERSCEGDILLLKSPYSGVFCNSGRSSGTIAPSTGHTCRQMPQSMQVEKSIQYQSVPLVFFSGPGWMQATGQASTQSATPSQVLVTMVCGMNLRVLRSSALQVGVSRIALVFSLVHLTSSLHQFVTNVYFTCRFTFQHAYLA